MDERRARLRIFFGASPGVGKTYAMLEAAARAKRAGQDIVIGVVDTHGRAEMKALLDGLGAELTEFDLDAALIRRPAVMVVDELAHTNPPGSRHSKRWQDVVDLLEIGIDVWTTLNVQEVESLRDVIQQITGVEVRETVPDSVLERADDLELVDVSPEELLRRLADGKVHVAGPQPQGLFERGNLLALRELALRRAAERVDADVLAYRREHGIETPWPTRDRILVCVGPSPGSERLIRATKRMAERMHATWTAAHVDVIGASPFGERDSERLEAHLRLVESLRGDVVRLRGHKTAEALLTYAREHNVTRIVAGKPTHSRWRDRLRGSMLDELIRGSGPIEVSVIAPIEAKTPWREPRGSVRDRVRSRSYVWAALAILFITAVGILIFPYTTLAEITMLYLLAIMASSLLGRGPSLLAASLAVLAFDFCFVPPRFTSAISDARYLLTFAIMFACGVVISTLVVRLRRQERDAVVRERRTAALQAFTRDVAEAIDIDDVATVLARHLEDTIDVAAAVLVPDDKEGLVAAAGLAPLAAQEITVARWAHEHKEAAGHGTDTLATAKALCLPLIAGDSAVGVLALQRRRGEPPQLGVEQRHLLDALARQAALAIARVQLAERAREADLRARTEELRSSLLSAVSHDLRTPLAVITGAATSLRDQGSELSATARSELVSSIVDDAKRLERVLSNLLQLTRVETGLEPAREWVPAEEIVGAALTRTEDLRKRARVETDVPPDLQLRIDPVLFEQVLINLLENAVKHGGPPFAIRARRRSDFVEIEVGDRGHGLPAGDASRLFEKFVRDSPAPGAGLGLAVVRAIVAAHDGSIRAENREGGGALFRITLPMPDPPAVTEVS